MKTIYFTNSLFNFKKFFLGLVLLLSASVFSQVIPNEPKPTEPEPTGYSTGKLDIKDPGSIVNAYTYDVATDRYIYTKSVDGFNINYPIILTLKNILINFSLLTFNYQ